MGGTRHVPLPHFTEGELRPCALPTTHCTHGPAQGPKQRWPRHHTPRPSNTWGLGEVRLPVCPGPGGLVACGPGAGSFPVGLVEGPGCVPGWRQAAYRSCSERPRPPTHQPFIPGFSKSRQALIGPPLPTPRAQREASTGGRLSGVKLPPEGLSRPRELREAQTRQLEPELQATANPASVWQGALSTPGPHPPPRPGPQPSHLQNGLRAFRPGLQ